MLAVCRLYNRYTIYWFQECTYLLSAFIEPSRPWPTWNHDHGQSLSVERLATLATQLKCPFYSTAKGCNLVPKFIKSAWFAVCIPLWLVSSCGAAVELWECGSTLADLFGIRSDWARTHILHNWAVYGKLVFTKFMFETIIIPLSFFFLFCVFLLQFKLK